MSRMPGGRPTKFTVERGEFIVQLVRAGNHIQVAAQRAGISRRTLYTWLEKAHELEAELSETPRRTKKLEDELLGFLHAYEEGEAHMEAVLVGNSYQHAMQNPEFALKFLAKRIPDRWTDRQKVDLQHSGGIEQDVSISYDEEVVDALDALGAVITASRQRASVSDDAGDGERP